MKKLFKDVTYNQSAGFVGVNKKKNEQDIRERILELTDFQRHQFSAKNYEIYGFYIGWIEDEEDRIQIDVLQQQMLKEPFKTRNSYLQVFNTLSSEDRRAKQLRKRRGSRVDGGRNMIHISNTTEVDLKEQANIVGNIVRSKISQDLNLTAERNQMVLTLLETESSVQGDCVPDQLMHCDVDSDDSSLDVFDAFIGILATQMGVTELRVLPRSHRIKKSASYKLPEFIYRVQLPRYYFLVGHPFLIHGGCGCMWRNTRLHFYHGLSEDSQSKTFFVKWEVKDISDKMKKMRCTASKVNKTYGTKRKRDVRP